MCKLAPSILSADFANLGSEIVRIDRAGADYIHIDMMDGIFVPNLSMGMPVAKAIRDYTDKVFDVHLMLVDPLRYVESAAKIGADVITVHVESDSDIRTCIRKIREQGCKVGLALSPDTPIEAAEEYLEEIDLLLLMTVYPGFGGQSFLPGSYERIQEAKERIIRRGLDVELEIDGGINWQNVQEVVKSGADVVVAGSLVFSGDPRENVSRLKGMLEK